MSIVAAMDPVFLDRLFSTAQLERLGELGLVAQPPLTEYDSPQAQELLGQAQILVTFWGAPQLTVAALDAAPELRANVHAAGSVKHHLGRDFWADPRSRGIAVSSAVAANARPVAEYALSMILAELKQVPQMQRRLYATRQIGDMSEAFPTAGTYDRTVGIIGASLTGRRLIELLQPLELNLLVYDPFLSHDDARRLGVRTVPLAELASRSDLVSIHAPQIPETWHMVDAQFLAAMPDGGVLVNTARGSLVDTEALLEHLRTGRLRAVLDVTDPEPLPADHELYELDNAVLTPHVAGSLGGELRRLGTHALAEIERFIAGEEFATPVLGEQIASRA